MKRLGKLFMLSAALILSIAIFAGCTTTVTEKVYVENGFVYEAENIAKENISSCLAIEVIYDSILATKTLTGSGFIISEDGYVITNAHVIYGDDWEGAGSTYPQNLKSITGTIDNGDGTTQSYNLTLVAKYNPYADLALLKMNLGEGETVKAVKFRDSSTAKYGEAVLMIGNPKGLGISAARGIISQPSLTDNSSSPAKEYILLDIAMNHGNSGGPVFDKNGFVIGVAAMRYKTSAASSSDSSIDLAVGIGYAVPSLLVQKFISTLNIEGLEVEFSVIEE